MIVLLKQRASEANFVHLPAISAAEVEDPQLRDLCNIAAKRSVQTLPADLRGQAT